MTSTARLLAWGLLPRALALTYLISFVSLCWRNQVVALAGARGISPLKKKLRAIERDFPSGVGTKWRRFPTLFWLVGASDAALTLMPMLGAALAAVCCVGGAAPHAPPHSPACFAAMWVIYLSMDLPVGLKFPWDSLLLEAGFIAPLLPAVPLAPALVAAHLPPAGVAFLYRLLLVRVMVGFGRVKFVGHKPRDNCYIQGFLISQPMPSVVGWLVSHMPFPVHYFAVGGMFVIEIIAPWFLFCTGIPRLVAAAAIVSLMFGIQLMGNFGYFNVLTSAIALPCFFDLESSVLMWDEWWQPAAPVQSAIAQVLVPFLLVLAMLSLPFQSWCNEAWVHWPVAVHLSDFSKLLGFFGGLCHFVSPFRIVAAYGVFPPSASPPLRFVTILEGSSKEEDGDDDEDGDWREYQWRFMTSGDGDDPRSAPMFIAPHHPRIDHSIFYTAFGINGHNMLLSTTSGDPYGFNPDSSVMHRIGLRLLQGDCGAVSSAFFQVDPFKGMRPPRRIRATLYTYSPTTMKVWWDSGCTRWWRRRRVGEHMPPIALTDHELAHNDRACTPGYPDLFAVDHIPSWFPDDGGGAATAVDLSDADSELFWGAFVAAFSNDNSLRCCWGAGATMVKAAAAVRTRHTPSELDRIKRAHARCRTRLIRCFEPVYFAGSTGRKVRAHLLRSNAADASFSMLELVANRVIGEGRAAFARALADPESALCGWALDKKSFTIDAGLFLPAVLYPGMFRFHARKWSVSIRVSFPPDAAEEALKRGREEAMLAAFARGEDVDVPATVPPAFFLWAPKWINQPRIQGALGVARDQTLPWVRPPKEGELWSVDMDRDAKQID